MTTSPQHARTQDPQPADGSRRLGRRALLRRAGTVVAVAGGAAAITAATSGTAQAANGDPVAAGAANSASSGTSLTGSGGSAGTLTLANSSGARAPLVLADGGNALASSNISMEAGSLLNSGGELFYVDSATLNSQAMVYTEFTANQVIPIAPVRALDTRDAVHGRTNIKNLAALDSAGRLKATTWLELDLSGLALYADVAFVNATVTGTTGGGFLTLSPTGSGAPATSTLNFAKGATVANCAVAPLSASISLFVYVNAVTHVIIDVTALNSSVQAVLADPAVAMSAHARRDLRQAALSQASALRAAQG